MRRCTLIQSKTHSERIVPRIVAIHSLSELGCLKLDLETNEIGAGHVIYTL